MHGMRIKSHKNQNFQPTVQQPNGRTVNLPKTFWQGLQPVPGGQVDGTNTEPQALNTPVVHRTANNHMNTHSTNATKTKKSRKTSTKKK